MQRLVNILESYRYIDEKTWVVVKEYDDEWIKKNFAEETMMTHQQQLAYLVLIFHHIWQQEDARLFQERAELLSPKLGKIYQPFLCFLLAKSHYFNQDFLLSMNCLNKAETLVDSMGIAGNEDYRKLLTCIGSLTEEDIAQKPDNLNLEYLVMKAILSTDRGNNFQALGQYDEAINAFQRGLDYQKIAYPTMRHANVAYTLHCLGESYRQKGMFNWAREKLEEARSIADTLYCHSHPEVLEINSKLQLLEQMV